MAVARTAKGTANSKTSGTTLSLASVAIAQDCSVVVFLAHDPVSVTSVTWNSIGLTKEKEETHGTNVQGSIWALHDCNAATGTVTVTFGSAIDAKAMTVIQLQGDLVEAGGRQALVTDVAVSSQGTGTAPASGTSAALTYPGEFAVGMIGVEFTFGSGGTSNFSNGQSSSTSGGVADTNIGVADYFLQVGEVTTGQGISNTGATSGDWTALCVVFKENVETVQDIQQYRSWYYTQDRVQDIQQYRSWYYTKDRVQVIQQYRTWWYIGRVERNMTAIARITNATSRTMTAKGNISGQTLQTMTAKGNIAGQSSRTMTAMARISSANVDYAMMF